MPELLQDSRRKFLEYFSINKRATVANEFLDVIRSGESVPGRVVNKVLQIYSLIVLVYE